MTTALGGHTPDLQTRRSGLVACLAAFLVLAIASTADAASLTIGQVAPGVPSTGAGCPAAKNSQVLEPPGAVPSVSYSVPAGYGQITSWSTSATATSGLELALNVYRQVSGDTYELIEHDGPHTLTPSTVNTFSTDLPVMPGDVIGLGAPSTNATAPACATAVSGASDDERQNLGLSDGQSDVFTPTTGFQDNVSAVVQPATPAPESAYVPDLGNGDVSQYDIGATGLLTAKSIATVTAGSRPELGALSPDGKSLYVPNSNEATVGEYDVGSGGLLAPKVPLRVAADTGASSAAVSPDGKSLYVANSSAADVSQYDIGAGGVLTPKTPATVSAGSSPDDIAVSRDGKSVYVANGGGGVSQYDVGTGGGLTHKTPATIAAGATPDAIAVSPDGKSVYLGNDGGADVSQYDVGAGGVLTPKSPATVAASTNPEAVADSPDGKSVYVADGGTSKISQYDVGAGGVLSPKTPATVDGGSEPDGIALTPDGKSLYLTNFSNSINQYDVASNGTLSPKTPSTVSSDSESEGIAVLPDQAPVAAFTDRLAGSGSATRFDGSSSTASFGGGIARYDWTFGDGGSAPNGGAHPTHSYAKPGNYTVTLTVTDFDGCSTAIISTGHMAYCNGGPSAQKSATVSIGPAGASSPSCTLKPTTKRVFAATVAEAKHKKKQKKGVLTLTSRCNQPASLTLTGKVTAVLKKVATAKAKHKKPKTFSIRAVHASVSADQTLTLTVKLPRAALALLKKGARESVSFTLTASNSNGSGHAGAKIKRLKLAKSKHK